MEQLKFLREKNDLTCQMMANLLGISKSYYWQIENKKRSLSYKMAVKISEIFKLKPDDVFFKCYTDNKNNN